MPTSTASAASVFAAAVTLCLLPLIGMPSAHAQPPGSCVPPPYYLDTVRGSWPAYAGITVKIDNSYNDHGIQVIRDSIHGWNFLYTPTGACNGPAFGNFQSAYLYPHYYTRPLTTRYTSPEHTRRGKAQRSAPPTTGA